MNDTSPEIAKMQFEGLMAKTGSERVIMGAGMFDAARTMMLASFPKGLSELEKRKLLYFRTYGEELPPAAVEHLKKVLSKKS